MVTVAQLGIFTKKFIELNTQNERIIQNVKHNSIKLFFKNVPRVENSNPLQYSCLKNPMDRGGSKR